MRAEQRAMEELWPKASRRGKRIVALDLACGTGRYSQLLRQNGAGRVVSMDFSEGMLARLSGHSRVRADMMRLPFASGVFDIVVSGLAVGHAPELDAWAGEVARVLAPGGTVLYSDFHPDAALAGMTRSFTDSAGRRRTLMHRAYGLAEHRRALRQACLEIDAVSEVRVGFELTEGFVAAEAFYRRWHGLPVVLAVRARKICHRSAQHDDA
jgi:malonyl-CoA O-methyltransferase